MGSAAQCQGRRAACSEGTQPEICACGKVTEPHRPLALPGSRFPAPAGHDSALIHLPLPSRPILCLEFHPPSPRGRASQIQPWETLHSTQGFYRGHSSERNKLLKGFRPTHHKELSTPAIVAWKPWFIKQFTLCCLPGASGPWPGSGP